MYEWYYRSVRILLCMSTRPVILHWCQLRKWIDRSAGKGAGHSPRLRWKMLVKFKVPLQQIIKRLIALFQYNIMSFSHTHTGKTLSHAYVYMYIEKASSNCPIAFQVCLTYLHTSVHYQTKLHSTDKFWHSHQIIRSLNYTSMSLCPDNLGLSLWHSL